MNSLVCARWANFCSPINQCSTKKRRTVAKIRFNWLKLLPKIAQNSISFLEKASIWENIWKSSWFDGNFILHVKICNSALFENRASIWNYSRNFQMQQIYGYNKIAPRIFYNFICFYHMKLKFRHVNFSQKNYVSKKESVIIHLQIKRLHRQ